MPSIHPRGLPNSPRPQNNKRPMHNPPYNAAAELSPTDYPRISDPPALHVRSRSQPPHAPPSPSHGRSTSHPIRTHDEYASGGSESHQRDRHGPRISPESKQRLGIRASRDNSPSPSLRKTTPEPYEPQSNNHKPTVVQSPGDGYAIWNAVTNVASGLTISVTKAWSAKITTISGEETPPGQESSLTRAMKAYHIAKAQKSSDLPDWLFDERERQVVSVQAQSDDALGDQGQTTDQLENDKTPAPSGQMVATPAATPFNPVSSQPRLRGTDRLKAMRDAKRDRGERNLREGFPSNDRPSADPATVPQPVTHKPRVGLPSGLQRGRR